MKEMHSNFSDIIIFFLVIKCPAHKEYGILASTLPLLNDMYN